jgi:hypothetical protein
MDDYMFQWYVKDCTCVQEATSYLEIFNYTVSVLLRGFGLLEAWGPGF